MKDKKISGFDEIEKAIIKKVKYEGNKSKKLGNKKNKKAKKKLDINDDADEYDEVDDDLMYVRRRAVID